MESTVLRSEKVDDFLPLMRFPSQLGVLEVTPSVQMLSVERYAPSAQITPSETIILPRRTESTATYSNQTTIRHRGSTELEEDELQEAEQLVAVEEDVLRRRHELRIHGVRGSEELDQNPT